MYQWDIEKVGIYILYLPSDIHVQKYFEEPKKIFHLIFSFNSISKSRTTSNCIIRKLFSLWNTSQLVNCRINRVFLQAAPCSAPCLANFCLLQTRSYTELSSVLPSKLTWSWHGADPRWLRVRLRVGKKWQNFQNLEKIQKIKKCFNSEFHMKIVFIRI